MHIVYIINYIYNMHQIHSALNYDAEYKIICMHCIKKER